MLCICSSLVPMLRAFHNAEAKNVHIETSTHTYTQIYSFKFVFVLVFCWLHLSSFVCEFILLHHKYQHILSFLQPRSFVSKMFTSYLINIKMILWTLSIWSDTQQKRQDSELCPSIIGISVMIWIHPCDDWENVQNSKTKILCKTSFAIPA